MINYLNNLSIFVVGCFGHTCLFVEIIKNFPGYLYINFL